MIVGAIKKRRLGKTKTIARSKNRNVPKSNTKQREIVQYSIPKGLKILHLKT